MEKDGLIKAKWKMIENKRFRRYYRLYELGYAGLEKEYTQCPAWKQPMIFS
jgi:DNA-binding PadR family transcriptional regulator